MNYNDWWHIIRCLLSAKAFWGRKQLRRIGIIWCLSTLCLPLRTWSFSIKEGNDTVAYCLQLPLNSKVHLVLHVLFLKQYVGPIPLEQVNYDDFCLPINPDTYAIIDYWTIMIDDTPDYQVLVEWQGHPREKATWEGWDNLVHVYATLALKDTIIFY